VSVIAGVGELLASPSPLEAWAIDDSRSGISKANAHARTPARVRPRRRDLATRGLLSGTWAPLVTRTPVPRADHHRPSRSTCVARGRSCRPGGRGPERREGPYKGWLLDRLGSLVSRGDHDRARTASVCRPTAIDGHIAEPGLRPLPSGRSRSCSGSRSP